MAPSKTATLQRHTCKISKQTKPAKTKTGDRQARILRELEIDGTGLKGSPPEKGESYYWHGARYEREAIAPRHDIISAAEEDDDEPVFVTVARPQVGQKRRIRGYNPSHANRKLRISAPADDDSGTVAARLPESSAGSKRLFIGDNAFPVAKRQKREPAPLDADELFREKCLRQFSAVKAPKSSVRGQHAAHILPFLRAMQQPPSDRIQHQTDNDESSTGEPCEAHVLPSADAKRLLAGNTPIRAPVFVPQGARSLFEDESTRPIEQVLRDWFIDENELNQANGVTEGEPREVKISALREHFLSGNGPVKSPWNLPDIPNPIFADQAVPEFATGLNSSFLGEMMRRLLDITEAEICQDSCRGRTTPGVCCDDHRLTVAEFTALHDASRFWRGATMLADAGAVTPGHWDQWGLGTILACYEGAVGYCWQSHPTAEQRTQWRQDARKPNGRYLYKVLRAGDALYMPPGTVHHVFRLPEGKQTLALSSNVLRRNALDQWLEILFLETHFAVENWGEKKNDDYQLVVPPLVSEMKYLLGLVKTEREVERYGGHEGMERVKKLLAKLEKLGNKLQKLAAEEA